MPCGKAPVEYSLILNLANLEARKEKGLNVYPRRSHDLSHTIGFAVSWDYSV